MTPEHDSVVTRITRTYTTSEGGSKFEDVDVPLDFKNWIGSLSAGTDVHEIVFRETDGAYDLDWHTAPCRQFIIMTNGGVDVTTTDGEKRRFQDGDILLVEDTTGKGHRSRAVDGKPRKSILVKLRDDAPQFQPGLSAVDRQSTTQDTSAQPAGPAAEAQPQHSTSGDGRGQNGALAAALEQATAAYRARHPESHAQHLRAAEVMPGGNTRTSLWAAPFPATLARGRGARVWEMDGHEYVDAIGEFTAGIAGHSHPAVRAAVAGALEGGINLGGHTSAELRFAQALKGRFPTLGLLRFTNSGTEANLMAVTAARAYTRRSKVMVFRGGYHGSVFLFADGLGDPVNAPFDYLISEYNDADAAAALIQEQGPALACVLVEPMLGSNGCIPATSAFMQRLRHSTEKVGALLILDEVMTSRLAPGGLQTALGIRPDLTTLGKYLGGGLSFGAFGGRAGVLAAFDPRSKGFLRHAGTFNNNALTMAAGYAGLTEVYTQDALDELNARGDALRARLNEASAASGATLQWTGRGSMMMPHFVAGRVASAADARRGNPDLKKLLFMHLNRQGVWTNSSCMVNLSLPFGQPECDALVAALETFLITYEELLKP